MNNKCLAKVEPTQIISDGLISNFDSDLVERIQKIII